MKTRKSGFLISKIHQTQQRLLNDLLKDHGIQNLNSANGRILFALRNRSGISINEISAITSLKKQTLTTMLENLKESGYICLEKSLLDKRVTLVFTTDLANSCWSVFDAVSEEISEIYYKGMSDEEIEALDKALEKIFINLDEREQKIGDKHRQQEES